MVTPSKANRPMYPIKTPKGVFLVELKTQIRCAYKVSMGFPQTLIQTLSDKNQNDLGLKEVPYERQIVEFVDGLISVANRNGSKDSVRHEKDWETVKFIYKGFSILYPQTHQEFEKKMSIWKDLIKDNTVAREHGGAMIQHKLEVPEPFYKMFRVVFPLQNWDKNFVNSLAHHLPVLMAGRSV